MTPRERAEALAIRIADNFTEMKFAELCDCVEDSIHEAIAEHVRALLADDEATIETVAIALYPDLLQLSSASMVTRAAGMEHARIAIAALRRKALGE